MWRNIKKRRPPKVGCARSGRRCQWWLSSFKSLLVVISVGGGCHLEVGCVWSTMVVGICCRDHSVVLIPLFVLRSLHVWEWFWLLRDGVNKKRIKLSLNYIKAAFVEHITNFCLQKSNCDWESGVIVAKL